MDTVSSASSSVLFSPADLSVEDLSACVLGAEVPREEKLRAVQYCVKKVQSGEALAQEWVLAGLVFRRSIGVLENFPRAFAYFERAAQMGDAEGQLQLGLCLLEGYGATQDLEEASKWFRMAQMNGHGGAAEALQGVERKRQEQAKEGFVPNYFTSIFWGPADHQQFHGGLQQCINQLHPEGIFSGDNLFTFGRNLSFLRDEAFMRVFEANTETNVEKGIIWRTHVLAWAAENGLRREGDFVECGCYKGVSSKIVCDYLNFADVDKQFYLYDLFYHEEGMDHHAMAEHGDDLYERTCQRFGDYENVQVIKGCIPEVFADHCPEKIAFLHIDMNEAGAEVAALEALWERMVPGAMLVLDDYGWCGYYAEQKIKEDAFFAPRGYRVVELPTGQGLVIK